MTAITLDIPPFPSPRMTRSDKWKKRPVVVNYFQWRKDFVWLCKQQHYQLGETIDIEFIIPMPETWSKKKRQAMNDKPHQQRPDIDNLVKSCLDAFNIEDGFVWTVIARKYWGERGKIIINV